MGRFINFLLTAAAEKIAAWVVESSAVLIKTGCDDPDPITAARNFADYCIRNRIDAEVDPDHPVGYYRVDDGLYLQAEIKGIEASRPGQIHLVKWATWRWKLLAQVADANHITRVYRKLQEKIRSQAIKDGRLKPNQREQDQEDRLVDDLASGDFFRALNTADLSGHMGDADAYARMAAASSQHPKTKSGWKGLRQAAIDPVWSPAWCKPVGEIVGVDFGTKRGTVTFKRIEPEQEP